jgi:IS30 family transposase
VSAEIWAFADAKLGLCWSPEQIRGYLKANDMPTVSHGSIYKRIYADKRAGGALHTNLRCQKLRKKRYGGRERRGTIHNQVSIDGRPVIVDTRLSFGDWEGDLVIGAGQQQALVTLNERKSLRTDWQGGA